MHEYAAIYDGRCRFCIAGSRRLSELAKRGAIELVSSEDPARATRFPGVSDADVSGALQLVGRDGRRYSGAAAIAVALATRPLWRMVTWVYWVPGLRQVVDCAYGIVARNRYRIMGKAGACDSGSCTVK